MSTFSCNHKSYKNAGTLQVTLLEMQREHGEVCGPIEMNV